MKSRLRGLFFCRVVSIYSHPQSAAASNFTGNPSASGAIARRRLGYIAYDVVVGQKPVVFVTPLLLVAVQISGLFQLAEKIGRHLATDPEHIPEFDRAEPANCEVGTNGPY